jgi:hypothetical protein
MEDVHILIVSPNLSSLFFELILAPRNSYPNSGSSSSGSNRYSGTQTRQQRGQFSSNTQGRQGAPTSTSWRTESPQQLSSVQPNVNYAKSTAKSPSLHSEERRQSESPATSKYSNDSNTLRTNNMQNRQQPQVQSYSPHHDVYSQQMDKRVPDNRYYDTSMPPVNLQSHQSFDDQPIITPIPRQDVPPPSYDNQQFVGEGHSHDIEDQGDK